MRFFCLPLAAASVLAAADGSTVTYADFAGARELRLVGSASLREKTLRLTPARGDQAGAAWFPERQTVTTGFETVFQFQLTDQGGLGKGADGLALVLQNTGTKAIAGRGSAGGFAIGDGSGNRERPGIPFSLAIFFDTYYNEQEDDPSDNYVAICTHGPIPQMRWPRPRLAFTRKLKVKLKDRRVHTVQVVYRPPVLTVFLDDLKTPVLTAAADLSLVADAEGGAYVGFTASTGGGWENHDVLNWWFRGGPRPDVSSAMVTSSISFRQSVCLADRNLCTPERASVEEISPGRYHVVLPAHLEWGASVGNLSGREVVIENAAGTVCWDLEASGSAGCGGVSGSSVADVAFVNPSGNSGALVMKTERGRTWFSVNDRRGRFQDNEGFFEFDVTVR